MKWVTALRHILRMGAFMVIVTVAPVLAEPDMGKYGRSCAMCHVSGAAGAPKTGDARAWEPRLAKGMDALLESVKKGLNAMPPTGLCSDCSDEEYRELISYMASGES
ncbi:MAG: c-type cytochrome [Luminiphilus sp.]|nr:c-type cytochrome [Luminiphilus sp.]